MCTIIYKVGGSLLSLPDLSHRLRAVLEQPLEFATETPRNQPVKPLMVVGGGSVADAVRHWDNVHKLGDELAHDLALRSMSFNSQLVSAILKDARVVANRAEAGTAWSDGNIAVLASAEFVCEEERVTRDLLPRSWDVTSDSVAAYAGVHWPAAALVLLKSTALPEAFDLQGAARDGLVDPYLPGLAARIPTIGWANLRADKPIIRHWLKPGRE
jgi:5-(aminomethyl)-3-furanmethanol phosphate kinase